MEVVSSFKYLGTVVDSKLSFNGNVVYVYKKAQQRLYLLRKLTSLSLCIAFLLRAFSLSTYGMEICQLKTTLGWHESSTRIARLQEPNKSSCETCSISLCAQNHSILHDKTHPLNNICFQHRPSGRRLKVPLAKNNVYKKYFIPTAVSVLNSEF